MLPCVSGQRVAQEPTYTVFVGRSEGKWAGQCREVDVFALMCSLEGVRLAIRFLLRQELGTSDVALEHIALVLT